MYFWKKKDQEKIFLNGSEKWEKPRSDITESKRGKTPSELLVKKAP